MKALDIRDPEGREGVRSPAEWTKSLRELWIHLGLLVVKSPLVWHLYRLPHGAEVGMRRRSDGLLEVGIRRSAKRPNRTAWERELATFRKYFEIEDWPIAKMEFTPARQITVYREPSFSTRAGADATTARGGGDRPMVAGEKGGTMDRQFELLLKNDVGDQRPVTVTKPTIGQAIQQAESQNAGYRVVAARDLKLSWERVFETAGHSNGGITPKG